MDYTLDNGILTVRLTGRVDSSNAEAFESALTACRTENPHTSIILDADELEYVSSAGLRVVLRTRKAEPTLKIVNVSSEVYEIFEMTGFTEMLPIEKGYRRLSVDGCEVIGQGANGKVYRLDPDTIIKVYFNPDSLPDIHRERELARKAFIAGVPTAIPYDVVKVGDGYGSVFELLNAKPFAQLIMAEPEKEEEYIRLNAELLKKIHSTPIKPGEMPDEREVVLGWARFMKDYLPADKYKKLYSLVEAVPVHNYMMHGDYHMKNVMMQNGEVLLIDMDTLCVGDPVFEFASVYLAYQGYGEDDHTITDNFIGIPYEKAGRIWRRTLELYFGTDDPAVLDAIADKAKVVGYTRKIRRAIRRHALDTAEGRAEIERNIARLNTLLDRVDSLSLAE